MDSDCSHNSKEYADTEHGEDAELFVERVVQLVELCKRQNQHPHIQRDVNPTVSQPRVVEVQDDTTRLLILPALPNEPSRLSLYQTEEEKDEAHEKIECERAPNNYLEPFVWEDSQKEGQYRCFYDRYGEDVGLLSS